MKKEIEMPEKSLKRESARSQYAQVFRKLMEDAQDFLKVHSAKAMEYEITLLRTRLEIKTASQKRMQQFSRQWAEFQFENAKPINLLTEYCPDLPRWLFERYIQGIPISLEQLRAERVLVESLLGWESSIPDACRGMRPIITSAPPVLQAGETYTILGSRFGSATGTITLHLDTPLADIPLTVSGWSDGSVIFQIPVTGIPGGIPLHAAGQLVLSRSDTGMYGTQCASSIEVIFEPAVRYLHAIVTRGDGNIFVTAPYVVDHTVTSPVIPPGAEPYSVDGTDVSPSIIQAVIINDADAPPSASIVSGPVTTSGGARQVTVRVTDDWAVNYWLLVIFTIVQPADIPAAAGWTFV